MWTTLDRLVNVVFLILALSMLSVLYIDADERKDFKLFEKKLEIFQAESRKVIENNTLYLEGRVNTLASNQDTYQLSSSRRLDVLESRIKMMENQNKDLIRQNKVLTYNNNINTVGK